MSFFVKPGANKKRAASSVSNTRKSMTFGSGRAGVRSSGQKKGRRNEPSSKPERRAADEDEIVSSGEESEDGGSRHLEHVNGSLHDDREQNETVDEARLRLTKQYLNELKTTQRRNMHEADDDAEDADHQQDDQNLTDGNEIERSVFAQLERDNLMRTAKLRFQVADKCALQPLSSRCFLPHKKPITCLTVHGNTRVVACDKSATVHLWDIGSQKRMSSLTFCRTASASSSTTNAPPVAFPKGLSSHPVSIAMSPDGSLFVVGCADSSLRLYETTSMQLIKIFQGHRGSVAGVAFHPGGQLLFSASNDRSVKVWSVPERAYMETLFGHTENITDLDTFMNMTDNKERCITAGGADKSIRVWKIAESTQLLYRTPASQSSVDCVRALNDEMFVTGGDDASVCLYVLRKNKPAWQQRHAHHAAASAKGSANEQQWISALSCVRNADLVASGAADGSIRMWSCDGRRLSGLNAECQLDYGSGFVNALAFAMPNSNDPHSGTMLTVAGIGQEHKWGRWFERKNTRDGVLVAPWRPLTS